MKEYKYNRAFTFIEIMVTVIILAILGIVGFFTLTGYLDGAKDSSTVTALNNIKTTLVSYNLHKGLYPEPSDSSQITYSGAIVWTQGTFGKDVIKEVDGSKENFLDPHTKNEYTYSVTANRKEFQVAGVLSSSDSNESYNNLIMSSTYAATNKKTGKAVVLGNYNGNIITVNIGGVDNILAIPSIIASDLSSTKLVDILSNNYLVYNNSTNLPASYKDSIFNVNGGENLASKNLVIFSGSLSSLKSESSRLKLLNTLKLSYKGTSVDNIGGRYIKNIDINIATPSRRTLELACDIVNFELNYKIRCNNDSFFAIPVINNNNIGLSNINFSGLISQNVNSVFIDSNGVAWFGTNKGLSKYSSGTWTSYTVTTTSNGLVNNNITKVLGLPNGNILLGTQGGVSVLSQTTGVWTPYTKDSTSNGLVNNNVTTMVQSTNGNIWVGTQGGVSVLNQTTGVWTPYTKDSTSNGLVNNNVTTIIQATNGNIWVGTEKGISVLNQITGIWTPYKDELVNENVKIIVSATNGNIWVGTEKGISVLNQTTGMWTPYKDELVNENVKTIFQSSNGDIWVGTEEGVSMYDGTKWKEYTITDGLINNKIYSIFEDSNNNIWFVTKKGISKLSSGVFTNYSNDNDNVNSNNNEGDKLGVHKVHEETGLTVIGVEND